MAVLVEPIKEKRFRLGPVCTSPYPAHMHEAVEIIILRKGHMSMTVNGALFTMEPNMIMVIFPGMIHSYESASEDAEGLFVGLSPGLIDEFHQTLITFWPVFPLLNICECPEETETAIHHLEGYAKQDENHPLAQAYIHLLLGCLLMSLELAPSAELNQDSMMYKILYYIQQHAKENLSLDSVAKEMGIGRSHLSHLLSQKLHIHFRQFLNTIRIEKACQMLQDPTRSIKEVCFECGYESTRTFHRAFMEEQKMTPGEYRDKMANGWVSVVRTYPEI